MVSTAKPALIDPADHLSPDKLYDRAWAVTEVRKREGLAWHTLDADPPEVGAEVTGEVDWDFRYKMMRTHTALHILCGIIYHEFGSLVTGNQMYPDRARMDFSLEDLNPERVRLIAGHRLRALGLVPQLPRRGVTAAAASRAPGQLPFHHHAAIVPHGRLATRCRPAGGLRQLCRVNRGRSRQLVFRHIGHSGGSRRTTTP